MNIFKNCKGILGELDSKRLRQLGVEFIGTARSISEKLGEHAYYLDRYLDMLLNALFEASTDNGVDRGFDRAYGELRHICKDVLSGGGESERHPFYQTAKGYIDSHPCELQDGKTKIEFYYCRLAPAYLEVAVSQYFKEREEAVRSQASLDLRTLDGYYNDICRLVGGEEQMERLNELIRQRFVIADSVGLFTQGFMWTELAAMTMVDPATGKPLFRILLEN